MLLNPTGRQDGDPKTNGRKCSNDQLQAYHPGRGSRRLGFRLGLGSGFAGTHPTGDGGAVCKGHGSCLVLQLDCKGTYTDATDKNGTVYGKCSQVMKVDPKTRLKLAN